MNEYCSIADLKMGEGVKLSQFLNLYGRETGDNTKIGAFVEIRKNATIGSNRKVSGHTFLCEGGTVEGVAFINGSYPRVPNTSGALQTESDWKMERTLIRRGASIGSGAMILANGEIGENLVVGAGSVVTKNVFANSVVAGNPARVLRYLAAEVEEAKR